MWRRQTLKFRQKSQNRFTVDLLSIFDILAKLSICKFWQKIQGLF